ncbi:phosphatase PAP2 family protein [Bythopirellula goksoeyrii]|uniref:Phosphatidylglycerophosphatase B n=1 Tax=Bythopirellula goksoeyrii TaxID=1400387 RepID=A0A5B9QDR6_9BACT|nr:phosphatase PAP2 family protein [Bythopirellula goksoeyrii]QEG37217.1 phosphatidylglycerophosphatase B [Bythopirellula goksoeyrii]
MVIINFRKPLRHLVGWIGGREPVVLLLLLALAAGTWAFIEIAGEVLEGDTQAFDTWMVRAMRKTDDPATQIGPPWVQEMGRDATALGGVGALTIFILIVAGYLWLDRKFLMLAFLLAATGSGVLMSLVLKHVISRPRPDIVPHLSHVATSSFPSGHSMLSAVVYLTLGSLLAASVPRNSLKIYVLAIAVLLSLIVGISLVYLGVHYPSDVLAGWIAGLVWALLCWLVARWLQRRHQVESDQQTSEDIAGK